MGQPPCENTAVAPIPATTGRDHAALALMPFGIAAQSGEKRNEPVTIAYQAEVDGRLQRVNVTLRPGSALTLPTPSDQMVFLALLQLALRQDPPSERLEFHRADVVEMLGWSDGGRNYSRLRDSLERLVNMSIKINVALVARDGREYQQEEEASHIVERYRIGSRSGRPSMVEWGHLVREAFRLGDFKRLDWNLLRDLGNPLTGQLYRLLDRVTMAGQTEWAIGWRPLAQALGMGDGYDRPAKFRDKLQPHLDAMAAHGVVDSVDYERGGRFVFHVRNYLRSRLRQSLEELGVYTDAARQLVAGFDETVIMAQVDCLKHGQRAKPASPGGYITKAVREGYDLRYPEDEPQAFAAVWSGMYSAEERRAYHEAALSLCGAGDSLFETSPDPTAWPVEFRAVVRFMMTHNLDPELVLRRPAAGLLGGAVG